jgi:hypothetical protein
VSLTTISPMTSFYVTTSSFDCMVGIQKVSDSKPLAPTILSLLSSIIYAAFADADFWTIFATFGTTEGNSNPNPHRSAHFLRKPTSSLTLS